MEAACASSSAASLLILHSLRPSSAHRRPLAVAVAVPHLYPSPTGAGFKASSSSSSSSSLIDLRRCRTTSLPLLLPSSQRCHQRRPPKKAISAVFERFTERAIKAVIFSQREARALGQEMVFNQHLLLGLVAEDRGPGGFLGSGITIDRARKAVRAIWTEAAAADPTRMRPPSSGLATDVPFSISSKRVFEAAVECSRNMGSNFIGPEHIAIGLFNADDGSAAQVLRSLGADPSHLALVALSRLQGELAKDGREPLASSGKIQKKSPAGKPASLKSPEKTKEKSLLTQFCVDLTARASEGLIDPVIGRDTEIQRIIQILCRRRKNNPILLGDAGVGKTAIAEGLALRIVKREITSFLAEKRILSLDVGLLMAGAKERGELEARVTGLIREVRKSGDIILFVDEVHTLIGSGIVGRGNKGSGLDIANLLKPSLGRGELQEDAVKILLGLREKYETYHKCRFTLEAINAAVYLSARYIPDRHLPDKAIDLIDEAGSRARMDAFKRKKEEQISVLSKSPEEYWQEIRAVQAMHEMVLASKLNYSTDLRVTDESKIMGDAKDASESSISSSLNYDEQITVGPEEIATVASLWSGIPVKRLNADERKLLVGLDEELKRRVIGQDEAVSAISRAVKRSRVGLNDPGRPIAALLFCGPTGVGKTELTKALAASYFGSEEAIIRLDMSEYMERHSVSKLIGSPPGYIGYGDGGTLTEAVRRRPFTVILLDEIEKAHPVIFNILLQVFEDGHLTDSQSNSFAAMKALVMEELKAYFQPELLNRIDEVIVFRSLERTQMMEILDIMLKQVKSRLLSLGFGLQISDAIKDLVCQQGFDRSYGARPLRRAVTRLVEDVISEAILVGDYKPKDTLVLDVDVLGNPVVNRIPDQTIHLSDASSPL
ncbi:hypothetical protein MUK42_14952 [Musa troglodytarum]|uniref:Clp R domain-containing protein n=1 Tax=Musa troglodytarum TaxID=320322 RepID=A0A9E7IAP5_9LILI|nr:hypothetical protein MUK42_14952 [Musa troglodytarum]